MPWRSVFPRAPLTDFLMLHAQVRVRPFLEHAMVSDIQSPKLRAVGSPQYGTQSRWAHLTVGLRDAISDE